MSKYGMLVFLLLLSFFSFSCKQTEESTAAGRDSQVDENLVQEAYPPAKTVKTSITEAQPGFLQQPQQDAVTSKE